MTQQEEALAEQEAEASLVEENGEPEQSPFQARGFVPLSDALDHGCETSSGAGNVLLKVNAAAAMNGAVERRLHSRDIDLGEVKSTTAHERPPSRVYRLFTPP